MKLMAQYSSDGNPFDKGVSKFIFDYPWVSFTFGSLFIIIGILLLLWYPKAKTQRDDYRKRQLDVFHKNNPNKKNIRYEQTRLYLPFWEKVKFMSPIFFGLVFIIIGISWMVGQGMSSL